MIVAAVVVAALVWASILVAVRRRPDDGESVPRHVEAWRRALEDEDSALGRLLLGVARPLTTVPDLEREAASDQWRSLRRKLAASGMFGGSVEVFLSVQAVALALAAAALAVAASVASAGGDRVLVFGLLLGAFAVAAWPLSAVASKASRREEAVLESLPDFAELLQMPLSSGMGILPALAFTADRTSGPVAEQVRWLTSYVRTNPGEEKEAFDAAAERLGTPEARAFFASLYRAHVQGSRVMDLLSKQAEGLRQMAYQRTRARLKRLPIRLVLIFAIHLLPLVFILTLLPAITTLGSI